MMNEFDKMSARKNEAREKKKKMLLIGIAICVVLIIVLAIMIMYYQKVDSKTFKVFVDDQQVQYSDGFCFTDENGETYVRAKDIANYVQWSYQNGEYGSYTEDLNSGYIQNEYEITSFVVGSNIIKKYIEVTAQPYQNEYGETIDPFVSNSPNGTLETLEMSAPIISQNEQVYFPLRCLPDICSCSVNYENPYRMYLYEQKYLISLAQTNAAAFGYQSISGIYENMRLLPYGLMCVSKGSLYGIVDLYGGSSIIGLKYTDMVFAQNVKEFFVKTFANNEESVGIIDMQGKQVVSPKNYNSIQILSDELGLYLVEKNGDYGVLNRAGKTIIHCEYKKIGIPDSILSTFDFKAEDNRYLLFNNTILVEKDGKYGIFNTEGTAIEAPAYVGVGYIASEDKDADKNAENVLTIELEDLELIDGTKRNVKAIIIQQSVEGSIKYGVYDAESEKMILPCIYDRIYGITSRGDTEYYIELQDSKAKFSDQLAAYPQIFEKN